MAGPLGPGYRVAVGVIRPLLMLFTRRDWKGAENLPKTDGFVIAPNHISHIDPLVIAHFLYDNHRPPRFLAKSGLFDVPVVGWVVRTAGQIPVFRESKDAAAAFSGAVAAIGAGECVAIYPEGTLTRDPDLWPMAAKTGAARVALSTGCPVIPLTQWGPQEILRPYTKRPHLLGRKVMHVTAGAPVDLDDLRGLPITTDLLRTATERIMARLTEQLAEIRGQEPPARVFDARAAGLSMTGKPGNPVIATAPAAGQSPAVSRPPDDAANGEITSVEVPTKDELSAEGFTQ